VVAVVGWLVAVTSRLDLLCDESSLCHEPDATTTTTTTTTATSCARKPNESTVLRPLRSPPEEAPNGPTVRWLRRRVQGCDSIQLSLSSSSSSVLFSFCCSIAQSHAGSVLDRSVSTMGANDNDGKRNSWLLFASADGPKKSSSLV